MELTLKFTGFHIKTSPRQLPKASVECLCFVSLLKRWMQIVGVWEPPREQAQTPLRDVCLCV